MSESQNIEWEQNWHEVIEYDNKKLEELKELLLARMTKVETKISQTL
ncbi:hypothetical protein [Flavobacterium sp. FPG59]|nr:hypothetical protein [Flavobacterium sp. FPG59]